MGLFRARITSFVLGFGLASGLALYQLRQDVSQSHTEILASVSYLNRPYCTILLIIFDQLETGSLTHMQANKYRQGLEKRVEALEAVISEKIQQ